MEPGVRAALVELFRRGEVARDVRRRIERNVPELLRLQASKMIVKTI